MRGGKLGEMRKEGVLIGYEDNNLAYRVWDPVKINLLNVGGCEFDEEVGPGWWLQRLERRSKLRIQMFNSLTWSQPHGRTETPSPAPSSPTRNCSR